MRPVSGECLACLDADCRSSHLHVPLPAANSLLASVCGSDPMLTGKRFGSCFRDSSCIECLCKNSAPSRAILTSDALSCRAESLFAAYYFFVRKGYEVTITSIKGGKVPIDPRSVVTPYLTTTVKKGLTDGTLLYPPFSQSVHKPKLSVRHCPTCAITT